MILVTGAAGKTGRAVIDALLLQGQKVRALVYRPIEDLGVQEIIVGDLRSPALVNQAMQGVRSVYFICPNMSLDELSMGQLAMAAARSTGVEHFVYHSVLHPQTEAMPHHWQKLRVEEKLLESGLAYTILQPAAYMQNILAHWSRIIADGVYPVPYAAAARLSLVDLQDVAAAAVKVLNQAAHYHATYELVGAGAMTQTEVAQVLAETLHRPVQVEVLPVAAWRQQAQAAGLGEYQLDTLVKMFQYYERFGLAGNPNVLAWLLGRPPTTFPQFVQRAAQERPK
ncbi:MAG: NmrA family NAD(P)-binding protein [Chloroflexota bacterium]